MHIDRRCAVSGEKTLLQTCANQSADCARLINHPPIAAYND